MHYGGAHLRVSGIKEGPRASGKSKRRPAHSFDRTVSVPHVRIPIAEPSGDYSESLKPRYPKYTPQRYYRYKVWSFRVGFIKVFSES